MYSNCSVDILCPEGVLPVTSTMMPPRSAIGSAEAPSILDWRGRMESWLIPRSASTLSGPTVIMAPVSMTEIDLVDLEGLVNLLLKVGIVRPNCL